MDERWTRNDEAIRSFIAAWSRMCRDEVDACFPTSLLQDPSRMITNISTIDETSTSIDLQLHTTIDAYRCTSIDSHSDQIVLKMLKWINLSTIHTCLDCLMEPKLTSNTKPDIIACLGAWYTWDRILQISLEACPILVTDPAMEADFGSREKLEREKLGTNLYLQFQILVWKCLHPVIDTPKDFLDVVCEIVEDKQNGKSGGVDIPWI
ncbi:hypothetical protein F2Q68_00032412 [Brassica cretica]|uniref:Uncharacterized protein n=1 Tax=Brassica cretica TaxID=69181 RepID=A0A8S9G3S1_BRACR|nr:hypothetical protein F2Q68_00032412 [Brassica cretica]